jgi:DNA repair protein RadA/Sms
MAATRTIFICQNCGAQSAKWIGKCPSCGEWNTYVEEVVMKPKKEKAWSESRKKSAPSRLNEVTNELNERMVTPDAEFNRVLGGGIVKGSVVLLGGEPGFGKSTLMLQLALAEDARRPHSV